MNRNGHPDLKHRMGLADPGDANTAAEIDYSAVEARVLAQMPPALEVPGFEYYEGAETGRWPHVESDLDTLAADIHQQNVEIGWWDQWLENKYARHGTAMMLSISELAEAMEGDRKDLMDDHLPRHKMFDVELADAAIRLLDLAGAYEIGLSRVKKYAEKFAPELIGLTPPEQLFFVIKASLVFGAQDTQVAIMLTGVLGIARLNGIDLFPIIAEKREYNARRADHKRQNRAAAGGKAY